MIKTKLNGSNIFIHKGSMVWIVSGVLLFIYAVLSQVSLSIPGVSYLIYKLSSIPLEYIYIAAFFSILLEGIYIIGNFFPGATFVVVLAVLAQQFSWGVFLLTIISIYFGWVLSGFINILIAYKLRKFSDIPVPVHDRIWTTWFPSFRSAYEVSQIVEGADLKKVLLSATKVRLLASIGAAIYCIFVSLFIDINNINDEEGFWSLVIISTIMCSVGFIKIKKKSGSKN